MLLSRPSRIAEAMLAFATATLLLHIPGDALAAIHSYTVTGVVDFLEIAPNYTLNDPEPVSGGETFTITFEFDDQAVQTSTNGTTVSFFNFAVENFILSIDNGLNGSSPVETVLEADNGSNHQWSIAAFPSGPSNLPESLSVFNELTASNEDFWFEFIDLTLYDFTTTAYAVSPPELIAPSSASFADPRFFMSWMSHDDPGAWVNVRATVTNVSSNMSAPVPGLALPGLAVLALILVGVVGATRGKSGRRIDLPRA
jgi:hypothetical protein